jgi:hypothetical protein
VPPQFLKTSYDIHLHQRVLHNVLLNNGGCEIRCVGMLKLWVLELRKLGGLVQLARGLA